MLRPVRKQEKKNIQGNIECFYDASFGISFFKIIVTQFGLSDSFVAKDKKAFSNRLIKLRDHVKGVLSRYCSIA